MCTSEISDGQMRKVCEVLRDNGVSGDVLQKDLLENGVLAELARTVGRNTSCVQADMVEGDTSPDATFPILVNDEDTFGELVERFNCGRGYHGAVSGGLCRLGIYDVGASSLFRRKSRRQVGRLVSFGHCKTSDQVKRELLKMGLRPATARELLVFGATYPDFNRRPRVFALGTVGEYRFGRIRSPEVLLFWGVGDCHFLSSTSYPTEHRKNDQFLAFPIGWPVRLLAKLIP